MKIRKIVLCLSFSFLASCNAVHKSIRYSDLDVQTKMSATIFLDPAAESQKTVLVQIRNTSDKPDFSIENEVKQALQTKGYKIVSDPKLAHYLLQANVLQVGRGREDNPFCSLNGGFGGAVEGAGAGALAGALIGSGSNNTGGGALIGGLVGGLAGTVTDALVEIMTYTMITDIQISERAGPVHVQETGINHLQQGTSSLKSQTYTESSAWKKYQTRIVSAAQKANLSFEEASPSLKQGLIQSLGGIL